MVFKALLNLAGLAAMGLAVYYSYHERVWPALLFLAVCIVLLNVAAGRRFPRGNGTPPDEEDIDTNPPPDGNGTP